MKVAPNLDGEEKKPLGLHGSSSAIETLLVTPKGQSVNRSMSLTSLPDSVSSSKSQEIEESSAEVRNDG